MLIFSDIILSNWSIISFTNHICVWSSSFWAIIYTIFCAIPISKEFPSIWQESSPNNYVTHWTNFRNQSFPVSLSVPSDREVFELENKKNIFQSFIVIWNRKIFCWSIQSEVKSSSLILDRLVNLEKKYIHTFRNIFTTVISLIILWYHFGYFNNQQRAMARLKKYLF